MSIRLDAAGGGILSLGVLQVAFFFFSGGGGKVDEG
jgi:hypothetical protein